MEKTSLEKHHKVTKQRFSNLRMQNNSAASRETAIVTMGNFLVTWGLRSNGKRSLKWVEDNLISISHQNLQQVSFLFLWIMLAKFSLLKCLKTDHWLGENIRSVKIRSPLMHRSGEILENTMCGSAEEGAGQTHSSAPAACNYCIKTS